MFPQRHAGASGFQIPASRLNRSLRHAMATHSLHKIINARRAFDFRTDRHRPQKFLERRPRGISPLIGIERPFTASALTPALRAIAVGDPSQNNPTLSRATKTRFEEMYQRQANFSQFN